MSNLIEDFFFSSLTQRNMPYRVLIPDVVSGADERLPVLYLLHGLFGSFENWADLTGIKSYVGGMNLLVVMPEGGDNWYTDSEEKYESYLIHDLMPEMESRFHAAVDPCKRAIAGNSMGGYGALKIALKFPEIFSFAGSFSGAFHVASIIGDSDGLELAPSISRVFGDAQSPARIENDLFAIAARANDDSDRMPFIYFDCGLDDSFISANREFDLTLSAAGIEHEYLEIDGGHDWAYWDKRIRSMLSVLEQRFLV